MVAATAAACDSASSVRTARAAEASARDSAAAVLGAELERARRDSVVRSQPGYVIDSILPVEEEIRRFQATAGPRPAGLSNASASRAALVREFVRAIERNDTTALVRLVVNRAEFGYLIYPTSPNTAPPYRLSPDLVWLMQSAANGKAVARLFDRLGGKALGYAGFSCAEPADRQGDNTVWSGCVVKRVATDRETTDHRMFGPIVRRGGRYKFLSFANGL
jgi:hypothetical protein